MARHGPFLLNDMIEKLVGNHPLCNSYFLGEKGKECILFDPGDNKNNRLDRFIDAHYSSLEAILLTHGHYDHILGLLNMKHKAPLYLSFEDEKFLNESKYNLLEGLKISWERIVTLTGGESLLFPSIGTIEVIATPFHTSGSLCYYSKERNALISGDTLFHLSYGRCDLPSGNERLIGESLKKLAKLPIETKVYPGHGEGTTLANELRFNPGFRLI